MRSKLNTLLTFQKVKRINDNSGGYVENYIPVGDYWAGIEFNEVRYSGGGKTKKIREQVMEVTLRSNDVLTLDCTFLYLDVRYYVTDIKRRVLTGGSFMQVIANGVV